MIEKVQDEILRKLHRELSSKAHLTEARVVYILCEIRKLLERTKRQDAYYALSFHCSWALHTKMDRGGATRILSRFDEVYELLNGKELEDLPRKIQNELNTTLGLQKFRDELASLLAFHNLPNSIVEHGWTKFLRQYVAVIQDCELTVKDESLKLQHITKVTVHKDDARKTITDGGQRYKLFRIRWVSHGKNNKTGTIEVYYTIP